MAIPRDNPAWTALATKLAELARDVRAANVVVADSSENIWCRATDLNTAELLRADWIFATAMRSATGSLAAGGTLDVARAHEEPYLHARSFGGIYVLLIWFDRPFKEKFVRELVQQELPRIEALTEALPPDEPDRPANAARLKSV